MMNTAPNYRAKDWEAMQTETTTTLRVEIERLQSGARTIAAKLSARAETSPPATREALRELANELSHIIVGGKHD